MLTYDIVAQAIQKMQERGERPSLRRILAETGGSKTDVSKHFRRWREEHTKIDVVPPPPEMVALEQLSPELASRIRQVFDAQYQERLSQAHLAQQAAEQHVEDLQQTLGDLEQDNKIVKAELDDRHAIEERLVAAMTSVSAMIAARVGAVLDVVNDLTRSMQIMGHRQETVMGGLTALRNAQAEQSTELVKIHEDLAASNMEVLGIEETVKAVTSVIASSTRSALSQHLAHIKDELDRQHSNIAATTRLNQLQHQTENRRLIGRAIKPSRRFPA